MALTLATAQANLTALEEAAAHGGVDEVTITTETGTRRVKYRTADDLLKMIGFWRREVTRLQTSALGGNAGPARAKFV